MSKIVDLVRHTDNDGDVLSEEGVQAAVAVAGDLDGPYHLLVSTGAQRATQTLACIVAAMPQAMDCGVSVDTGFRSDVEDRWKQAAKAAGTGQLEAVRDQDADLVDKEAMLLGGALQRTVDALEDGQRALVVGHSPTNEAAVLGFAGEVVEPLGKGEGVRVEVDGDTTTVTRL